MSEKYEFEAPPPLIPQRDIQKVLDTEVVVVGAGVSGLAAALSSVEAGAKTVLLEKDSSYNQRGLHIAAFASRLQKQAGIKIDKDQVIYTIMEWGGYRGNQNIVKLWADNCDEMMDWLLDLAEAADVQVVIDPTVKSWYFPHYPLIHVFMPKFQETLAEMLLSYGRQKGVDFHFETPAVRLIRGEKGRVSGVIAREKNGDYLQVNASKGVVLCSGDYGGDPDMLKKYCWPALSNLRSQYPRTVKSGKIVNTGDGHKMAMWVGAAIDEAPHCAMLFDWAVFKKDMFFNLGRQPWLYVNSEGKRFMNEDLPWGYECAQIMQQTGNIAWPVWDSKWEDEVVKMHSQCCKNMGPPTYLWHPDWLKEALKNGDVVTADTIPQLAEKMGVPADTFSATVDRYNELVKGGKDLDYGKHSDRLTPIDKPPFYSCKFEAIYMVILSGLKIDTNLQVLDTEKNPIPGLYAAGNTSGSFFAYQYPTTVPGLTHSRALTFGRLAGKNAASQAVQ
ncbi:MAG: FAD-dependent oxidoreductase [Dehalococcoidales bacterium]|nr:FAD-dependent oxidoreductase [Dehalococcoidales bacterium]